MSAIESKISPCQLLAQAKEKLIAPEILRERFNYDPLSGVFRWRSMTNKNHGWMVGKIAGQDHPMGYRLITVNRTRILAHRVAWAYHHGEWPNNEVDHINQIKNDNRIANLRVVTGFQNHQNRRLAKDNRSGVTGVCFQPSKNRWVAEIMANGVKHHLIQTDDFFKAVCARKSAENRFGFHRNHGTRVAEHSL